MAAVKTISSAAVNLNKRKRSRTLPKDSGEISDIESCDLENPSIKTKKARFLDDDFDDDTSHLDIRSNVSASDSLTDNGTPFTDVSSVRSKTKPRAKKFPCTFPGCSKAFDRPVRLQTHINSHTGERPHACTARGCDKRFFKAEHLKQHVHDKHTDYQGFVCTYQVRQSANGGTTQCGKAFPTSSKLKRHFALHEQKEETTCSWEGCGKVFRKQETLQRHLKKDHLGECSHQCLRITADREPCGKSFATPGQLKGHEAQVHDEPKFWCEICRTSSVLNTELDAEKADALPLHNNVRLSDHPEDCDDGIIRTLDLHEAATQGLFPGAGTISFTSYADFRQHMKHFHPPTCLKCRKICSSNRDLNAHIEIHHLDPSERTKEAIKFFCPYDGCSRSQSENGFTRKGNMDVHIKTVHAKAREFICGDHDFGTNEKLQGWSGQGCGMALGTKQSLLAHIRTQHLGVPAAIGVRTGLRDEDRKRKVRVAKKASQDNAEDFMDVDLKVDSSNRSNDAISMLTGAGYEEQRPFPCLLWSSHGCQFRFVKEYDLSYHMEMTHGWTVDDINDALLPGTPLLHHVEQDQASMSISEQDIKQQLERQLNAMQNSHCHDVIDPQLQAMDL